MLLAACEGPCGCIRPMPSGDARETGGFGRPPHGLLDSTGQLLRQHARGSREFIRLPPPWRRLPAEPAARVGRGFVLPPATPAGSRPCDASLCSAVCERRLQGHRIRRSSSGSKCLVMHLAPMDPSA
uniref:Uncharacterized protein n=1 Tax=Arundo donax TaxID=35708 RepID=A0A0A8Z697_ARUDO